MVNESQINAEELGKFLLEAKRATWASGKKAVKTDNGGEYFIFAKSPYFYKDKYYDNDPNPFIGQEIVSFNGKPIWGMNYYGWLTEEGKEYKDQEGLAKFLREALSNLTDIQNPFRGPEQYPKFENKTIDKKRLIYLNHPEGDLFNFQGKEWIIMGKTVHEMRLMKFGEYPKVDNVLFELDYRGGII